MAELVRETRRGQKVKDRRSLRQNSFLFFPGEKNSREGMTEDLRDGDIEVIKEVEVGSDKLAEKTPTTPTPQLNSEDPASQKVTETASKTPESSNNQQDKLELNEALLQILGEEPSPGEEKLVIHTSIAKRWGAWLKAPMTKEVKEDLFKKYPREGEFSLEAPKLNEELNSSINESSIKRDRYFIITQNMIGTALSALAPAITSLIAMKSEEANKILGDVWNAARVMAEIHRSQTGARRACILPSLAKPVADALSKREADQFLFGQNLGDKLTQLKTLDKLGQEIKMQTPKKPQPNNLNWRSSSASQKPTSQTSYKVKPTPKTSTPKVTPKPTTYPRSSQYQTRGRNYRRT